jgi:hypothetical protein
VNVIGALPAAALVAGAAGVSAGLVVPERARGRAFAVAEPVATRRTVTC